MALAVAGLGAALLIGIGRLEPWNREERLTRLNVDDLRRIARDHPDDALIFLVLGQRLRQEGRFAEAFVMTSRAYDLSGGEPRFTAAKVAVLSDRGEYEAALELATAATRRWPRSGELTAQLSRIHAARGAFVDAQREAEAAVRLTPRHAPAWQALGNAWALNKRPEPAFAAFERALQLEPRDAELLADYGDALARYGRTAEAEAMLARSIALAPQAARPVALLGQVKAGHARSPEEREAARALLEEALARAPAATDALYQLALLNLRDGRARQAVELLKRLLALDPAYGEAHLAMAQAYQKTGDADATRQAFAAWRRFSDYRRQSAHLVMRLRRRPEDKESLRRLIQLHALYGNRRAAEEYRRRLSALESGDRPRPGLDRAGQG